MESITVNDLQKEVSIDVVPSMIKDISEHEIAGFDTVEPNDDLNSQSGFHHLSIPISGGVQESFLEAQTGYAKPQRPLAISLSMPSFRDEANVQNSNIIFGDDNIVLSNELPNYQEKQAKFYSQPMPNGSANQPLHNPRIDKLKDERFDPFKTWSGKLERQISNLRRKHYEGEQKPQVQQPKKIHSIPVDRYFDALEGPELDTLRDSEEILLPENKKWPFLLRFQISSFGVCLGVSSQAIMWKSLASSTSTKFLNISSDVNLVLWFISIALVAIVTFMYSLKIIFYFEAVRREYYHPIRVNFFFAPWIALLFLALGAPTSVSQKVNSSLWYVLMAPILCLEIKIYGQWMSGGERRLSKVANPSNHLSIVGNFVGALLGSSMGLKEGPIFFFAIGLAHYTVLFVTLYQRLPTNETLPKELHPVFFLFVAAPSVASTAWATIQGSFDYGSRITYFIALFLYISLAVRVNFFRGFRFTLAWWAYTFPMTGAAIATIRYSNAVDNMLTKCLAVLLCAIATLTVTGLLVTTLVHAFVLRDLFPNDIAIAISDRKQKVSRKWYHRRSSSSDSNTVKFLKYSNSDVIDIEASLSPPNFKNEEFSDSVKNVVLES